MNSAAYSYGLCNQLSCLFSLLRMHSQDAFTSAQHDKKAEADLVAEWRLAAIFGTDVFRVVQGVAYAGDDFNACEHGLAHSLEQQCNSLEAPQLMLSAGVSQA